MAQLLILNRDATPALRSYKRGDIVAVVEDGHEFGRMEGLPDFVRASLPGVPRAALDGVVNMPHKIPAAELAPSAVRAIPRLYANYKREHPPEGITRRRYRVPDSLMTPDADGYIAITLAQLEDKRRAT